LTWLEHGLGMHCHLTGTNAPPSLNVIEDVTEIELGLKHVRD
jgi:hypothetical protein